MASTKKARIKPAFVGLDDAALYLGISSRTLRGLVYERRITFHVVGNRYLFGLQELDEWMERNKVEEIRR